MTNDDKEEKLYKVDTVPPPAGESDAYNAPTKVGPMAASVVAEMMKSAVEAPPTSQPKPTPFGQNEAPTSQRARLAEAAAAAGGSVPAAEVPRLYDVYESQEDAEEDKAATMVSTLAKPPLVTPTSPREPTVLDDMGPPSAGRLTPPPTSAFTQEPVEEEPRRNWVDFLLIFIIVAAASGAIYLLRQ
jgi:hypothetical protein